MALQPLLIVALLLLTTLLWALGELRVATGRGLGCCQAVVIYRVTHVFSTMLLRMGPLIRTELL